MRRCASWLFLAASVGLLSGCTGTGVFLDHTTQWFGRNPNTPAGSSETFLRIRGENVDVPALVPETGDVWPAATPPDQTLEDVEKQQNEEIRRGGGQPTGQGGAQGGGQAGQPLANGSNPQVNRANQADRGLPPPQVPATAPPRGRPSVPTPGGQSLDVGGGSGRGYRQLQQPGQSAPPTGGGILVPNGNGTSTLIGPDGSVQTVPTR